MIYHISLSTLALVLGVIYLVGHLSGLFWPKAIETIARQFPRHLPTGIVLTVLAGLWWVALVTTADLGEFSTYRNGLIAVSIVLITLTVLLVHQFLAVRGLALLLLLGAQVILDAAFMLDTPARLVMTCLAYAWAIEGIAFIAMPYLLRDTIDFCFKTPGRQRFFCGAGTGFGMGLILLGIFVY